MQNIKILIKKLPLGYPLGTQVISQQQQAITLRPQSSPYLEGRQLM